MNIAIFMKNIIPSILNKTFFILIFFWGAINITPEDVITNQSFFSIRLIIPFLLSIYFIFNYRNYLTLNISIKLIIILQIITIIGNFLNLSYLYNLYWPIILIGYIIFSCENSKEIIKYNEKFILFITLVLIAYVLFILYNYKIINAYEVNNLSGDIIGMPMSRSTGIARFAGLSILYVVFTLSIDTSNSNIKYIMIFICVLMLCMLNTRGAVLSTAFSLLIFFTLHRSYNFAVKIFGIIILSYIFYTFIIYLYNLNIDKNLIPQSISHIDGVSRKIGDDITSGRFNIWFNIFQNYNYIGLFGFGSVSDKILIGQNASGSLAYIFISSGFIGTIIYIIFNIKTFFKVINEISKNYKNKINIIVMIIFFSSRAIYENSFTIYSIDALIYIPYLISLYKNDTN